MVDIGDVLDAVMGAAKAQAEYNQELAKFQESGGYSWDWDGYHHDKLEKAKNKAKEVAESYIREIVRDELSKAEGRQ